MSEKISGIYAIYLDNRVYVGESVNISTRQTVDLAKRLGLKWEIICELPNSTKRDRLIKEHEIIQTLKNLGLEVVSNGNYILGATTSEERKALGRKSHSLKMQRTTSQQRSESAKKGWSLDRKLKAKENWDSLSEKEKKNRMAPTQKLTQEQHKQRTLKSWETRRKKEIMRNTL